MRMARRVFKILLSLLGNKELCNERYIKAFSVLTESLQTGGWTLYDYCKECKYHKVLIIGENELGSNVAACLTGNDDKNALMVTVCTTQKITNNILEEDFEKWYVKSYRQLICNRALRRKIKDYDCVWIADYNLWLKYRLMEVCHLIGESIWHDLTSLLLQNVSEKRDVPNLLNQMEELENRGIKCLHIYIPSYQEVCNGIKKKIYISKKEKMTEQAYKLLFGYRQEKYEEVCHEFNTMGGFTKKGILILSSDTKGNYFNIQNGERLNISLKKMHAIRYPNKIRRYGSFL